MKSVAAILCLLSAAGCAHAPAGSAAAPVPERAQVATAIRLRYATEDRAIADEARRALRAAVPAAEQWGALPRELTITIHPTHAALEAAAGGPPRPWLRGLARRGRIELQSPRTWSTGRATEAQLVQLLAHELTHCVLYEALGGDERGVPAWFWEGMATSTAGERFVAPYAVAGGLPGIAAAASSTSAPELYGAADRAFRHLVESGGRRRLQRLVTAVARGAPFPDAFEDEFGVPLAAFETAFGLATAAAAAGQ